MRSSLYSCCFLAVAFNLISLASVAIADTFNPNSVDQSTKSAWCVAQIETCPKVCQSANSNVLSEENTCNSDDLTYVCSCVNGFAPDMARYTDTVPYFICQQVTQQCVVDHPNDITGQSICEQEAAAFCDGSDTVTSVFHVSFTQSGSVASQAITLTLVEQLAQTSAPSSTPTNSTVSRTSSARSTSSTSSTSLTTSPTTSPTSPTSSTTQASSSGLSTGALAAAIAVPIVVLALIAAGLGVFFYRKRQGSKTKSQEEWGKAELHAEPKEPTELAVQERYELPGDGRPGEMAAREEMAHEAGGVTPR